VKEFYENQTTQVQAVEEFKKALDLAPGSKREQLNFALALLRAGKSAEAVALLEKVQKSSPELPHTWFNLGIVYKKQGEFAKALPQFERLVKLASNEPVARYNLGVLYKQENRTAEAIREFQTAARLNPTLAAPHFQLFNMYRASQKSEDAARELAEFQRLKKAQEGAAIPEDMEWCDFAEIYDPVEALPPAPPSQVKYVERAATALPGLESFKSAKLVPGDFNNDGLMDRAALTPTAAMLCRNTAGRFRCTALTKGSFNDALWVDFDHDYDLDLLLLGASSKLMRNQGAAGFADRTADFPFISAEAIKGRVVRVEPDSKAFDLVVNYRDRAVLYRDRLAGRYEVDAAAKVPPEDNDPLAVAVVNGKERVPARPAAWIGVTLQGVKNLKLGQGSLVEVRAGTLYEKKWYRGVPLRFDLRGYKEVDTVRITWPNGLIQNETRQAANREYVYKEAQRLSGSCPMIWTWNGREFQFITDVLGVAPLGASSGDGEFFPVDHDEYVMIPASALAAKDGALELRVTEELSEVTYLDELKLYAVDHPAAEDVFVNEKWKGPPFPEFRFYGAGKRVFPVSARDQQGRDVLPLLTRADTSYPDFRRTENGVAELHSLTLDFGNAAPGGRAVLLLNGWVDWADGSTFRAAAQESKQGLVPPSLQVKDDRGEWRTVVEDMGVPDGKPKTIPIEVRFLSASREVRIVTNLAVYWDHIFLSETTEPPPVRQTEIPMSKAKLNFRGFSETRIHPERKQPDWFFYTNSSPLSHWNPTPGMYTRYGDVRPLLNSPDDMYVIMGSGDEIRLKFDPSRLPVVPGGWRREYMVKVDGWAKDRDANTAYSQTVEPLPFHRMSRYPYPASEKYPETEEHRRYLREYNTRPALRLIRELVRRGAE
jgi:tetratricopeptide (TPR) repeat protein